jgi:hypothetical protein
MWFGTFWLADKKQPEDRGVVFGSIQGGDAQRFLVDDPCGKTLKRGGLTR